ncbi:hypothetical protein QLQ12_41455 [Actinoplanes sp. NEAU-A12]|uniref:Uncharacterized protein n=1 Tax=Actinoplanes sandaracinus TaxID=3045177 RepID=A0ABT6WZ95_9ACTN|nr:hypothetical protein [Actinoplanes sandaracinus]MDI6105071.1 hypothetical protein [Actinoplanes sandaracinus]
MTIPQASRRTAALSFLRCCATAAMTATCALTAGATAVQAAPDISPPTREAPLTAGQLGAASLAGRSPATWAPAQKPFADKPPATARLTKAQRKVLVEATRRYHDVDQALADGYLATDHCVPGMGWHYAHPGLSADAAIDPVWPEVLLYVPGRDGSPQLIGVEYFKADADGSLTTDSDRPTLFGNAFNGPMAGHEMPPGAPPMPVHYDLHVWLYTDNPAGELAIENPQVTCP